MKAKLIALLLVAGGLLFAESRFSVIIGGGPGYYPVQGGPYRSYQRQDLRGDYRDIQRDYAQVDRFRADMARDRYQLHEALEDVDDARATPIPRHLAPAHPA